MAQPLLHMPVACSLTIGILLSLTGCASRSAEVHLAAVEPGIRLKVVPNHVFVLTAESDIDKRFLLASEVELLVYFNGELRDRNGGSVPGIMVPPDATHLKVNRYGDVACLHHGAQQWTEIGRLLIVPRGIAEAVRNQWPFEVMKRLWQQQQGEQTLVMEKPFVYVIPRVLRR